MKALSIAFCLLLVWVAAAGCGHRSKEAIQAEFTDFVEEANGCRKDSDCVVVATECPLGCFVAVNAQNQEQVEAKARALVDEYEADGVSCMYACVAPGEPKCKSETCSAKPASDGSGGGDGGAPHACTEIGCASGFEVELTKKSAWAPGEYRVVVNLDGRDVVCNVTFPLDCNASAPCGKDTAVLVSQDGCALPAAQQSLSGVTVNGVHPDAVSVTVSFEGEPIGGGKYTPEYAKSQPNGPGCDPICYQAPSETANIE